MQPQMLLLFKTSAVRTKYNLLSHHQKLPHQLVYAAVAAQGGRLQLAQVQGLMGGWQQEGVDKRC